MALPRLVRTVTDYLPRGRMLPEEVWRVRHRTLSYLLWAHVPAIFVFALTQGNSVTHAATESGLVAAFAVFSGSEGLSRAVRSSMVALGLVASSAVLVHLSGGMIEMHFHFFVMVAALTLYQDWLPFLLAIGFVVVHHAVLGSLFPHDVYNHPAAVAHPFRWALIHGAFVLSASAACLVSWRLNEEQALKDALTRLPNRRLFQDRVAHALARAPRQGASLAVLFIDLDGFKDVNDSLGHAAGDQLLVMVAERLRAVLRPADTAARLGGDEFAVLLEDIGTATEAAGVAERLLDALTVPFEVRDKELSVAASVGISLNAADADMEQMLRNADVAMYTAKAGGRGQFRVFEDEMHRAVVERVQREADLFRGVERKEFVLFYQPVVSLETGSLHGFEALVRWRHPTRGLLAPVEFLALAEETGAIVPLGLWVVDEACRQTAAWRTAHPGHPFTMSVNVSPLQLHDAGFVSSVAAALTRNELDPRSLILELTEEVAISDSPVTLERLQALKQLGVQLAVDDFGTGYSSFSYLRRLPFDIVKIDKLFVDDVALGSTQSAFARAILNLALTLELRTVAEGVEEASQEECLRRLGCELGQGYRFARPLPADDVDGAIWAAAVPGGGVRL